MSERTPYPLSTRQEVAALLKESVPYAEITRLTGVGKATITKILRDGPEVTIGQYSPASIPTFEEIQARALAIRQAKGHLPEQSEQSE